MIHLGTKLQCSDCGATLDEEDFKAMVQGVGALQQAVYFIYCMMCVPEPSLRSENRIVASGW